MQRLKQYLTQRTRARWETGLTWFRLRYHDGGALAHCLRLLSRAEACARVALRYQPGTISALYMGIPPAYAPLLRQMAGDFRFLVTEETDDLYSVAQPLLPLQAAPTLPWERPFAAHLVDGHLFVSGTADGQAGSHMPEPAREAIAANGNGRAAPGEANWRFPMPPEVGLSAQARWPATAVPAAPAALRASEQGDGDWLLGWGADGEMLAAAGRVNLYGEAAAAWLAPQLIQTIAAGYSGLVVLDGVGEVAQQLKRQALVTRLLGRGLTYVDIDGLNISGFDPLAAVPEESEEARLARRATWFRLMGAHAAAVQLLAAAPLSDLAGLQRWLVAPAQRRSGAAAEALERIVAQLWADRQVRQWLEWPRNQYETLPEGALVFACRGQDWARRQLVVGALLAVSAIPGIRLVAHGVKLEREGVAHGNGHIPHQGRHVSTSFSSSGSSYSLSSSFSSRSTLRLPPTTLLSNGPLLAGATPVLTAGGTPQAGRLARRFLGDDSVLQECLHLLQPGEAVVCAAGAALPVTWRRESQSESEREAEERACVERSRNGSGRAEVN